MTNDRRSSYLRPDTLEQVARHATIASPSEACGLLHASGLYHAGTNVQDELHTRDPVAHPRTARTGYSLSAADLLHLARAEDTEDPVAAIVHSHPGGYGAYFSDQDVRGAVLAGEPSYDVDQLVVAVDVAGAATEAALFRWVPGTGFVEIARLNASAAGWQPVSRAGTGFHRGTRPSGDKKGAPMSTSPCRATVEFTGYLRVVAGGAKVLPGQGATVAEAVADAATQVPLLAERLLDPGGRLRRTIMAMVDDELADSKTMLHDGATVTLLAAAAGGLPTGPVRHLADASVGTPLVGPLNLAPGTKTEVFVKYEAWNPTGSHKDRAARAAIGAAEQAGELEPGSGASLLAPTGGNYGAALAAIALERGYSLVTVMPDDYPELKIRLLEMLGADVRLSDHRTGPNSHGELATAIYWEAPNRYVLLDQFNDPANVWGHYTAGYETLTSLGHREIDYLVAGIGSGAHITGIGRVLKSRWPNLKIVGVQPKGCEILAGVFVSHGIPGLAVGVCPKNLDTSVIDEMMSVTDGEAVEMLEYAMRHEALSIGLSSAANLCACRVLAEGESRPLTIVTIAYDRADSYLVRL